MPELPDITVYLHALQPRIVGHPLHELRIASPSLLKTFNPPVEALVDRLVVDLRRLGKRIAIGFEGNLWCVIHLMIAGRLQWAERGAKIPGRSGQAAWDFPTGTLLLHEAGTSHRAGVWIVKGIDFPAYQPAGIEPLSCTLREFTESLQSENHTLKRALTSPHLFSGIGNAYSDEILHRARLSPVEWSTKLTVEQIAALYQATQAVLQEWTNRLLLETGTAWPQKVTAFRPGMAVHGKFGHPCPVCRSPVQRIRYADHETNYCARCQTDGQVLADRSLSRLLKQDWPRRIEDWG
jgi:formamidopyrimidine-DNA glycosylase